MNGGENITSAKLRQTQNWPK